MSMPLAGYFTANAVRALPDDGARYETVHGELLVTPAPSPQHQGALAQLFIALSDYLRHNGQKGILWSPADISWDSDTLVQPDLFVADTARAMQSGRWSDIGTLHLVIEVLSPSSLRADRFTKRRLYQEHRIAAYWIVDTEQRHVEVWTPDALFPVIERLRLTWRHPAIAEPCVIAVADLFDAR